METIVSATEFQHDFGRMRGLVFCAPKTRKPSRHSQLNRRFRTCRMQQESNLPTELILFFFGRLTSTITHSTLKLRTFDVKAILVVQITLGLEQ